MISSILPVYLFVHLQLSPVQFGLIDGLYQGVTAVARLASGIVADRWRRYKLVATIGYALSAVCKLGLLATGSAWSVFAAVLSADRLGKGIRTAPRDALISLTTRPQDLAVGVRGAPGDGHRRRAGRPAAGLSGFWRRCRAGSMRSSSSALPSR